MNARVRMQVGEHRINNLQQFKTTSGKYRRLTMSDCHPKTDKRTEIIKNESFIDLALKSTRNPTEDVTKQSFKQQIRPITLK